MNWKEMLMTALAVTIGFILAQIILKKVLKQNSLDEFESLEESFEE